MSPLSRSQTPRRSAFLRGIFLFHHGRCCAERVRGCAQPESNRAGDLSFGHPDLGRQCVFRQRICGVPLHGRPYRSLLSLAITLPGATQYTDKNVVAGQTYFYTLTAFDSANLQSLPTTAVSVTIPSP